MVPGRLALYFPAVLISLPISGILTGNEARLKPDVIQQWKRPDVKVF